MSGGAFQYAFTRVEQFADDVLARLAERPESFSDAEVERLALLVRHCVQVADWMKAAEWLVSGDTGENEFLRDTQGMLSIRARLTPDRERVARAICVACEEDPERLGDARGSQRRWQDYLDVADGAIAAMKDKS